MAQDSKIEWTHAGDRVRGLYRKFSVLRTDGSSEPGGKHADCEYFVLDLEHDPFSGPALRAYADACEAEYPALAHDLRVRITATRDPKPASGSVSPRRRRHPPAQGQGDKPMSVRAKTIKVRIAVGYRNGETEGLVPHVAELLSSYRFGQLQHNREPERALRAFWPHVEIVEVSLPIIPVPIRKGRRV